MIDKRKIRPRAINSRLSLKEKNNIKRMLLGPFHNDWYDLDGIINNTDLVISKRLDLPFSLVALHTNKILKDKEDARLFRIEIAECKSCANTILGCHKHKRYFKNL